jgi:hypothetical protein
MGTRKKQERGNIKNAFASVDKIDAEEMEQDAAKDVIRKCPAWKAVSASNNPDMKPLGHGITYRSLEVPSDG